MKIEYLPCNIADFLFLRLKADDRYYIEFERMVMEEARVLVHDGDPRKGFLINWWPGKSAAAGFAMLYVIINLIEKGQLQFAPQTTRLRPSYEDLQFLSWIPGWSLSKPKILDFVTINTRLGEAFEATRWGLVFDYLFFDHNQEEHGTEILQRRLF